MQEVEYKQEFLCMAQDEVQPLAEMEWEESGHPTTKLNIDWDTYAKLEDLGKLQFYTARKDSKLIGYFVVLLVNPLTVAHETVAYYDSIYVHPDHRRSRVAINMFSFVEKCIKSDKITRVVASSSSMNPIDKLLNRLGYSEIETKFEKVI